MTVRGILTRVSQGRIYLCMSVMGHEFEWGVLFKTGFRQEMCPS